MNRIDEIFARLRGGKAGEKRAAFMPYITAGLPDLEATAELLTRLPAAGADLIELGIPFSDSVADGPTIQTSFNEVLTRGIRAADIFATVRKVRDRVPAAICGMVSFTLIDHHGVDRYVGLCGEAGIDGLIVPDLPPEEAGKLRRAAEAAGIATIFLVAPTTSPARLTDILAASRGFVYCISVAGITGERAELPAHLTDYVARLREATDRRRLHDLSVGPRSSEAAAGETEEGGDSKERIADRRERSRRPPQPTEARTGREAASLPLCVGFGISTPAQSAAVGRIADGVIVGSAVVKRLLGEGSREARIAAALQVVRELSAPLRRPAARL